MSVTQCRSCDQPITFVLRDDGRWRPVEVTFEELAPEGDEMLAVQKAGSWQTLAGMVRVYKAHRCIEDPSWNQGRPKLTVRTDVGNVDVATGEIDPDDEDEQTDAEWRVTAQAKDRERALRKMSTAMQFVMLHDCPECAAPKGEPCQSVGRWPIPTVCRQRKLMAAFGEGQHWPPRNNQIGFVQLKGWLEQNASIFTPPTGE